MSAATQTRSKPIPPPATTTRPALAVSNGKPTATTKPLPAIPAVPVAATPTSTVSKPRTAPVPAPSLAKPSLTNTPSPVDLSLPIQATPKPSAAPQLVTSAINNDKSKSRIPVVPAPPTQLPPAVTPKGSDSQIKSRIKPSFPPGMSTPMATPAPSTVRSYSEIVKSEEALNQLLIKKNQELKDMRELMSHRDSRMNALEAEISSLKETLATTQAEAEARLRDTMALHSQQYKELNTSFLNLTTRSAALENKLEECGINPLSLRPWDIDEEDQAAIDAEQAEMERVAREIEETFEAKSKEYESIRQKYADLEASLPELLEMPPPESEIEEMFKAELDNLDYEMMKVMKEMGLHESTPLGDVTEDFNGHPSEEMIQEFAEDYVEAAQAQEEDTPSEELPSAEDMQTAAIMEDNLQYSENFEEDVADDAAEDKENL